MTILVTTKHMRLAGYCTPGSREFGKRHGLDWRRFIKSGLPTEEFEKTGDAMAFRIVEIARGQRG